MSRPRSGLTSRRRDGRPVDGAYYALPARDVQAAAPVAQAPPGPNAHVRVLVACCVECRRMMGRGIRHRECEERLVARYRPAWARSLEVRKRHQAELRAAALARRKVRAKAAKLAEAASQPRPRPALLIVPPPQKPEVAVVVDPYEWARRGLEAARAFYEEMHSPQAGGGES